MDLNISPIWKGQHVFLKPVLFTSTQAFNGANIKFDNQQKGALAYFNGKEWCCLNITNTPQALVVINGLPTWGNIDASIIKGTLGHANGGTGISNYNIGEMLYVNSKLNLAKLTPGNDLQILTIQNKIPFWSNFPGVKGSGKSSFLAVWTSDKDISESNIQIDKSKLSLQDKNASIELGNTLLSNTKNGFSVSCDSSAIHINKSDFTIQHDNKTILKFVNGVMTHGEIPVERIKGFVDVSQGGTGHSRYSSGDILYAIGEDKLSTLSVDNSDGFYLKSVNGRPQWAPITGVVIAQSANVMMELLPGTTQLAPLRFQIGDLTHSPQIGAVEWDGNNIYVTTSDKRRKAVVFQGENIIACSKGVTEIIPLHLGGTGKDLSSISVGSVMFADTPTTIGFLNPEGGKILRIHPETNLPFWSHAVIEINVGDGISINKEKYVPTISINQNTDFTPRWLGVHTFAKGVSFENENTLVIPSNINSGLPQLHFEKCVEPSQKRHGDIWFNEDLFMYVNGATVNITSSQSSNQSMSQIQQLKIFEGVSSESNTLRKIKYPLPFSSDGKTKLKWKFVRADLRIEDAPAERDANIKIFVNENLILDNCLTVIKDSSSAYTQQFVTPYAYSGDLISVEFGETGGGDCWGLYLTIASDS